MQIKNQFFYQRQAGRYQFDANLAVNTNAANYAREMMERAKFAEEMLDRGDSEAAAWAFFQTGKTE